jgi:hypothetical protein
VLQQLIEETFVKTDNSPKRNSKDTATNDFMLIENDLLILIVNGIWRYWFLNGATVVRWGIYKSVSDS